MPCLCISPLFINDYRGMDVTVCFLFPVEGHLYFFPVFGDYDYSLLTGCANKFQYLLVNIYKAQGPLEQ
jgi:hypothetical protein